MIQWMQNLLETLGYPGLAFLMLIENLFPPIPSEFIMPLAGFSASRGDLTFIGVVLAGTLGAVVGAIPLYYLGALIGEERLIAWADRYGKWLGLDGEDIRKADDWFDKHGPKAVLLARLLPGIRSLISVPAGISGMALPPFLLYTTIGAGLWCTALAYAGSLLGENYEEVEHYVGPAGWVILGSVVLLLVWRVVQKRSGAKKRPQAGG
jgi:membrane protein DedA with SNARE-associated domain